MFSRSFSSLNGNTGKKCQTTYSRKAPNCGTYFFKHVSSSEDETAANGGSCRGGGSSTMISSSSPTPRPADDSSEVFTPLVLTSSPLKTSDSEIPLFDDDELQVKS